jgi:hypothetical protein
MGTTGGASQWNFVPLPMVLFLDYLRQWRRLEINFTGLQAATFSIAISTKVDHFYFANNRFSTRCSTKTRKSRSC